MRTNRVDPDLELLGIRVTGYTPLGQIVGPLRQLYPDASLQDLKSMADQIRRSKLVRPADPFIATEPEAPTVVEPKKSTRRRPKTEADASLVPVEGGEPIPAEPPVKW